ncbi:hypothetical protein [[Clostridium] colinum]|uniref:hypothetical protein n=1 Tax=[Clostridium] colinum TaxID=36835 RepID=UPI00202423FA|nr:hypothetical protein [[Clostridium] colinum]
MYLSRWKNFIIIFLIFLAIYQTTGLWFEEFSTHSFFYLSRNKVINNNIQKDTQYLTESILINTGNNKFIRKYNNISNTDYKKIFDEVIYTCIKNGDFYYLNNFSIDEVLNNKSVIYTYSFNIKGEDASKIFNINGNHFSKIKEFDTIIILPIISEKYNIKTIFLSSKTSEAYEIKINKDNLSHNVLNAINEFNNLEPKSFYYISSEESGISLFSKNQFLPKAKEDSFNVNNILAINPLEQDGGILLSESEKYVNIFFDNPITKTSSFINNTYTYNDQNIIVKYYPNGVLEYVKYKSSLNDNQGNPYKIALQFLGKDTNIKNEYYLKDYKMEENKTTFYFDYKINNFPIMLSNEKKEETGMQSMIEITIEDNIVSKYKRIIYDFVVQEDYITVEKSFIKAIDSFLLNNKNNDYIDEMKLIYNFNNVNEPICIRWLIGVKDEVYYEDVAYGG